MNRAFIAGRVTSRPRTTMCSDGSTHISFLLSHNAGQICESTYVICTGEIARYVLDTHLLDGTPHLLISGRIEADRDGIQLIAEHIAHDTYPTWLKHSASRTESPL